MKIKNMPSINPLHNVNNYLHSFSVEKQKIIEKTIAIAAITLAAISVACLFLTWPVAAVSCAVANLILSTVFLNLKLGKQRFNIQDLQGLFTKKAQIQIQTNIGIDIQEVLKEASTFAKRDDPQGQCAIDSLRNPVNWKFNQEDESIEILPKKSSKGSFNIDLPTINSFDDQKLDFICQMASQCSILDYIHGLIRAHLLLRYPSIPIIKYAISARDVYIKIKFIQDTAIVELKTLQKNYPISILNDEDHPIEWDRLVSDPQVKMTFEKTENSWEIDTAQSFCSYTLIPKNQA